MLNSHTPSKHKALSITLLDVPRVPPLDPSLTTVMAKGLAVAQTSATTTRLPAALGCCVPLQCLRSRNVLSPRHQLHVPHYRPLLQCGGKRRIG
jgi:hypothetical protein